MKIKQEPNSSSNNIPTNIKSEPQIPLDYVKHDTDGNQFIDLGRNRRASLTSYRGKQMINIRQYFLDKKQNKMVPGKKGITLSQLEWNKLVAIREHFQFQEIPKKIKVKREVNELPKEEFDPEGNSFFDIGRNRRVGLSIFDGKKMLNIREYYLDENNDMRPGKRGIALYEDEWMKLMMAKDAFKFCD